ncbi:MAG: hypothetical protein KGL46_01240 [Hyphomicrobiales bacterium]|nr:hypothetical protein [Hyphomicrobiales bacterium]
MPCALTMRLFEQAGQKPHIAEIADEKQTIVNLVAARLGAAIVPRWTARIAARGVRFAPLKTPRDGLAGRLPLAAAWARDSRDETREAILSILQERLRIYARSA